MMPEDCRPLRIFVASPGDVADERKSVQEVFKQLQQESPFKDCVEFEVISWEDTPLLAAIDPEAAIAQGLATPSQCDIVIVILWSRMGTPMDSSKYLKPNGEAYVSGTEWEYENAMEARRRHVLPEIVVYRRTEKPSNVDDMQYKLVEKFFEQFNSSATGAAVGGVNHYQNPDGFQHILTTHMRNLANTVRKRPTLDQKFIQLLDDLDNPKTPHSERPIVAQDLLKIGDKRPGIDVNEKGLPDLYWCPVSGGGNGTLKVEKVEYPYQICADFYVAKYPITNKQFESFLDHPAGFGNDNLLDNWARARRQLGHLPRPVNAPYHPRDNMVWIVTIAYCTWLNATMNTAEFLHYQDGWRFRLPTEWEWQYTATGGIQDKRYPWDDNLSGHHANTAENRSKGTIPVGLYPYSHPGNGVLDLIGNVWEWCLNEAGNGNPAAYVTSEQSDSKHILRGGSWRESYVDVDNFERRRSEERFEPNTGLRLIYAPPPEMTVAWL